MSFFLFPSIPFRSSPLSPFLLIASRCCFPPLLLSTDCPHLVFVVCSARWKMSNEIIYAFHLFRCNMYWRFSIHHRLYFVLITHHYLHNKTITTCRHVGLLSTRAASSTFTTQALACLGNMCEVALMACARTHERLVNFHDVAHSAFLAARTSEYANPSQVAKSHLSWMKS